MLSARNRTAGQATLRDVLLATPPHVVVGRPQHGRPRSLAGTWVAGVRRFGPLSCVCRCFGSSPATKHLATGAAQTSPRTCSAQPSPDVDHWPPVSNHRGLPGASRTSSGTRYSQPSADANKDLSVSSHRNHRGSSRTPPSKNCSLTSPGTSRDSPVTNSRHLHEGGTQTTPSLGRRYPSRKNPARDKAAN
ncbi:hypothetical protein HPB52_013204 [Rhipicephalus sanguineus]|uniref:Uncharacterized protein n=1 Tax=Rhipicephalus sanguineus TaxID=34632 RepID=A0A9D4Q6K6_RHISA|nr:hypothetical protein HPB52_013204 [Rhipicephalus sanguineus]